jgi:hypothetical protein
MSIVISAEPNLTGTALDVFADRKLMHEARGGKLLSLSIIEHVEYPAGAKLPDITGSDVAIAGAVRKLAVSGGVVRQVAIVGTAPDLYFPPS